MLDNRPPPPRGLGRLLSRGLIFGAAALLLTGCQVGDHWWRIGMPEPITEQGDRVLSLWQGSMIAAAAVGALVLGLIMFSVIRHRKRSEELPPQVRYNLPIEAVYTLVPVVIVAFLFYFTARDQLVLNKLTKNPDLTIGVVGFQWSWQFNYVNEGLQVTGRPGEIPQLVLPTDRRIRFVQTSPDVIHSFWVPAFLFKRDVIPGRTNQFEVTINKPGTFRGKCAEYCGVDHDRMLFSVRAVSPAEFDKFLSSVKRTPGPAGPGTTPATGPAGPGTVAATPPAASAATARPAEDEPPVTVPSALRTSTNGSSS